MTRNTIDVSDLLFAGGRKRPIRDYLVNKNGEEVWPVDLEGKTIVLIISNYLLHSDKSDPNRWFKWDLADAYMELMSRGDVEFVSVPVDNFNSVPDRFGMAPEYIPRDLLSRRRRYEQQVSTMPWPALAFHHIPTVGRKVAKTFSIDASYQTPFWVIIDPKGKVVATQAKYPYLFKLFGGAELKPLSPPRIHTLWSDFGFAFDPWDDCNGLGHFYRCESRKQIISKWDEHLASPPRDFLLSSNGDKVPISSLQDKVIGLYFCENMPHPPQMKLIKKVYDEAKERGYAFEIVQINFHYHFFNAIHTESVDLDKEVVYGDIKWLRLPFKDPSCRKLQRMFECNFDTDYNAWYGDCLVIIDPRKVDSTEVLFEFSGAEILEEYGIRGFPFTRESLLVTERERQKEELTLESVFAEGCRFIRSDGRNGGDVSQLIGKKRVVVLLGGCEGECNAFLDGSGSECKTVRGEAECKSRGFVSMLKSKYLEQQLNDEAEGNKFEVVYVSMDYSESSFKECIKGMPWLVHPYCWEFSIKCFKKIFKVGEIDIGAGVFGIDGALIAKEHNFCYGWGENELGKFPFVSQDLDRWVKYEVEYLGQLDKYHYHFDCPKKDK